MLGLNSNSHVGTVVPLLRPFPSFLQMRSMLLLEELKAPPEKSQVTVLVVNYASKGGGDSSNGRSISNTSYSNSNTNYCNNGGKKRGKSKGSKGGNPWPTS